MKHRVVVVQDVIPLYTAGLFQRVSDLQDVDLTVIADLHTPVQLNQYAQSHATFRVVHVPLRRCGPFKYRPGLIRAITKANPEVVILNCSMSAISEQIAALWCKCRRIPLGIWDMFHRIGPAPLPWRIYQGGIRQVADILLSYGKRGFEEQVRRGVPEKKVVILSTAIEEQRVFEVRDSISVDDVARFRDEQKLGSAHVLLQVVRLTRIKRPDLLIQYFNELLKRRGNLILVLIGGGPLEPETRGAVNRLGLDRAVRFIGPLYDERVLGLWYKSASVFVIPTCIGLSIHHAMAYGLPVVTDDNLETQASEFEALESEVNGLTYVAGSASSFADQVERVIDDSSLRARLSAGAVATIARRYTFANKVDRFHQAIEALVGSAVGARRPSSVPTGEVL